MTLGFEDPLTLLNRRIIAYYSDLSQTDKEGPADNLMRAIVRENLGSSATDTTRSIASFLTVEPDSSLAPTVQWGSPWSGLMGELKNLAQASYNLGTYLSFDVETSLPAALGINPFFVLNFAVRKTMLGNNHTVSSGAKPVLIGPDYGNMSDVEIEDDWTQESNHLYVGGEGDDSDRLLIEVTNVGAQNAGPMTRYEEFTDHSDLFVSTDLTVAGNADLANKVTRTKITGNLRDSDGVKYGVDVNYGDYVTAQVSGYSVDCHLKTEHITWNKDSGEVLDIRMEGTLP